MFVVELLGEGNENGYYAVGYTDDITIIINWKFLRQSQRYDKQPW
jgi:hypothetical protein